MRISVRLATPADVDGIVGVIRAVYDEYGLPWDPERYHADLYDLEAHYLARGHPFWVAEAEAGQIIGTAALELFDAVPGAVGASLPLGETLRLGGCDSALKRLYVHPAARRQGVGSRLMETVIEEARRRGCRHLEIWSDQRFREAHRLYARFGAVPAGERIIDDPEPSPEWGLLIRL